MATVIDTVERDGRKIRVYDSGAELDDATGRIVKPPDRTLITVENSTAMHRARQEQKRARILAGAAKTLDRTGEWSAPNDLDVVEALGEAVMMKALNPDSAKQVDAARFILQEAGLSAAQERNDAEIQQPGAPRIVLLLAQLHERQEGVIDGLLLDTDISRSNNLRVGEQEDGTHTTSPTGQPKDSDA